MYFNKSLIHKKNPLFPHKCLTFGHPLVKLHFLQCTLGEQSTTATGKVFENTTGGRLEEPKSLFLYGVFHTKHKHWGVLTELLCPPAVYAYDIGQLLGFGWNGTLDRKFLTYWGFGLHLSTKMRPYSNNPNECKRQIIFLLSYSLAAFWFFPSFKQNTLCSTQFEI